jgi:signal transduction histidine kinase
MPDVTAVPALIERFRAARTDVTLAMHGDTGRLPATCGLAVYRILQEALTNAVRHAPGAAIAVELNVGATAVSLSIDSAGKPRQGSGIGMISMRERAEALGGDCAAGPGGRGWLVRATLPLQAARRDT